MSRYESPFCQRLYELTLDTSWLDDEQGSVDGGEWSGRVGRRVLIETTQGFVYYHRFPTVDQAAVFFAELA